MRIISGSAGGIPILVPKSLTRPTTDRVRESLFSTLGSRVFEAKVLDLFAGSGALGLESLSRGARTATFVEQSKSACTSIQKNLAKARFIENAQVHQWTARRFLKSTAGSFDLIFADPPYARDEDSINTIKDLLEDPNLPAALSPTGLFLLEHWNREPPGDLELWIVEKKKTYGNTCVTFLRPNPEPACAP